MAYRVSDDCRAQNRPRSFGLARLAIVVAFAVASSVFAGSASAQEGESGTHAPGGLLDRSLQVRDMMVSAMAGFHYGYYANYGVPLTIGGRFYIPIVHEGFIPQLNDEFGIEFGLDLNIIMLSSIYTESTLFGFGVPVDVMWDFHITPNFDAYAKLGLVIGSNFSKYSYGGFWWTIREAVGLRLKITEGLYFRAEAGFPAILAGLGFAF